MGRIIGILPTRNRLFTGREEVLELIRGRLSAQRRVALRGLGGIGKTATAIEYAHRFGDEYGTVIWVDSSSHEAMLSSLTGVARSLGGTNQTGDSFASADMAAQVSSATAWVRGWLNATSGWLLVLDNTDDLSLVRDLLPSGKGHVLITTQATDCAGFAEPTDLGNMNGDEGALLFLRRSGRLAAGLTLTDASVPDRTAARILVDETDGLPLALNQAAAYVAAHHLNPLRISRTFPRGERDGLERRHARGRHSPP